MITFVIQGFFGLKYALKVVLTKHAYQAEFVIKGL